MAPPNTRITVFGGTYPAQIWAEFMSRALADTPPTPLVDPATAPIPTTTVPDPDAAFTEPLRPEEMVEVPDVSGIDIETAAARVRRAGLEPEQVLVRSSSAQPGRVITQSPVAGTSVSAGATVWLEATAAATTTTAAPPPTTTTTTPATTTTAAGPPEPD